MKMKMVATGNFTAFLAKLLCRGAAVETKDERAGGGVTNSCMRRRTEYKLSSWKTSAKCHLSYFSVERRQQQQQ